jgi:hypothetical protein
MATRAIAVHRKDVIPVTDALLAPPPPLVPDQPFAAISADDIARAFSLWHTEHRANPGAFAEAADDSPDVAGVRSAEYFLTLLARVAVVLILLCVPAVVHAQDTIVPEGSSLRLAWDAGDPPSVPAEEAYKVRLLSTPTPNSVQVIEFTTSGPTTTYQIPNTALPSIRFYAAVRALRVVNTPGESLDSNVIGPFMRGTAAKNPRNLSGTVVPTVP